MSRRYYPSTAVEPIRSRASGKSGEPSIIERPVGNDPAELRRFNPDLDIWDTYVVSHVIMPDGSMKLGGDAVAEVLRCLPGTKWIASCCDMGSDFISLLPYAVTLVSKLSFGLSAAGMLAWIGSAQRRTDRSMTTGPSASIAAKLAR